MYNISPSTTTILSHRATENLKNRENKILYRVADLNGDELEMYVSYDDLHDDYNTNSRYPRTYRENYELNNLRIWEWDPSSTKYATKSSILFYELINYYNIATLGEEKIITCLKDGIEIPGYNNKKSLLVIGEDKDDYKVIEIDSSNVISKDGISKIKPNFTGYIDGFILNKEDFISTENVVVMSSDGKRLLPRTVYKYLNLPYPDFKLDTLDVEGKLELFINKVLKLNEGFTRIQKREIRNIFNEILKDYNIIESFFEEYGFNEENLKHKIDNISSVINNVLSEDNKLDKFCKGIIENIPSLNKKFTKLISDRFTEDNKEEIENLNLTIKNKKQSIEELSRTSEEYEEKIEKLINDRENLQNDINYSGKILDDLDIALRNKAQEIRENMATLISDTILMEMIGRGSTHNSDSSFFIKSSTCNEEDVEQIIGENEFASILSINLEIAGIAKDYVDTVSKYITGTLVQRNNLYLVGKFSNYIADSISITYCGMKADVISVISPSIDVNIILKMINKCTSSIVLIENLLNLNETVAMILPKLVKEKTLIFSSDIPETLSYMPDSILNSFNVLCLDFICDRQTNEKFIYANASEAGFTKDYDNRTYKAIMDELQESLGKLLNSSLHHSVMSELVAIVNGIGEEDGIYSLLLCEIIPILAIKKNEDLIEEVLNLVQLSDKKTTHLRKIVGLI